MGMTTTRNTPASPSGNTPRGVKCGNKIHDRAFPVYHPTAADVRACFQGVDTSAPTSAGPAPWAAISSYTRARIAASAASRSGMGSGMGSSGSAILDNLRGHHARVAAARERIATALPVFVDPAP